MPFFKKVDIIDATEKYGFTHRAVVAAEFIKKGESVFSCDIDLCVYKGLDDKSLAKTGDQVREIFEKHPHTKDFILGYGYMVDDDLYDMPEKFMDLAVSEELCMLINHSCEPNLGFSSLDDMIAIRDIETGEEIAYDYQCMDTEATFYKITDCKCGSLLCRKNISRFDQYRNVDWQNRMYKWCGEFVQRKIDELQTKWFSTECYLKRYLTEAGHDLRLTTLTKVPKNVMVAKFSNEINPSAHYIRHSTTPNCYLDDNQVLTLNETEAYTELTLNYNSN